MTAKTRSARSNPRLSFRRTLLIGASVSTLIVSGAAFAQSRSVFGSRGGTADPAAAAARAAQDQAGRAAQTSSASQRAIAAFRRAADTRSAMSTAQAAARAAAQAAQSNIPNGLGAGGLQVANGVPTDPSLWIGANGPVQSVGEGGHTNVTIDQTQQKAILTWDSFNVGRETDLRFNQGGADWVALNRVTDASADPTKILGSIKAPGSVYIINRNGIMFGGASQINVRNLIASTANITDADFLNRGIYSALSGANYVPSFTSAGGKVRVEAGAQIATNTPTSVTAGGGFVLLMGTEVANQGTITTPRGQTTLVAGDNFILRRGFGTEENLYSTTRGNEVRGLLNAGSTSGAVTNAGLIEAAQGDITLAGRTIRQDGVAIATTSVNQRGTIHLLNSASDTLGSVTLGKDSLTTILPELDSKDTALDGQRDTLIAQSNTANAARASTITSGFDDRSLLADRLDQGRVEIVTGGNVLFEGGSQTIAQGGQVAVQANNGRITVADDARIEVSGVMGVSLDMESNSIKVNVQGNELRDSPANREGSGLKGENVWIDVRDLVLLPSGTGGYEGDRWYTPGGLLEVGGYLANTAHGIGEWAAVGGTITLAASEVVAHKGAQFDISGGSLDYAAGWVRSSRVMGADGRMYDIRNAPAFMQFVAVGNAFMRKHNRWGDQYTEVFSNPLFSRGTSSRWQEGYTVGRDGGKLILSAPTVIMEGDILAQVLNGEHQVNARADGITDGYKVGQHTVARAGSLAVGRYGVVTGDGAFTTDVKIGQIADLTDGLAAGAALPGERTGTVWFNADRLNGAGLGGLQLETKGAITIERNLILSDGGAVSLIAPTIDIKANVTARAGSVSATNIFTGGVGRGQTRAFFDATGSATITLREGATVDLRGLWVNTALERNDTDKLGLLNGGSVYFASTHDVTLEKGSFIDVSSGGAQLDQGAMRGGRGGNVTLVADFETAETPAVNGLLTLDGKIAAYGANGSGTLKVESGTGIAIGGKLLETDGVLKAGEKAPFDVVLTQDYAVGKGDILPIDYSYSVNIALPGEKVPPVGVSSVTVATAADWLPPAFASRYTMFVFGLNVPGLGIRDGNVFVFPEGKLQYYYTDGSREFFIDVPKIPAGSQVAFTGGAIWAGWVVDPLVFPNGLAVPTYRNTVAAGQPSPIDLTIPKGTVIAAGRSISRDATIARNARIDPALFQSGFSNYDINGRMGVVAEDVRIDVTAPALRFTSAAGGAATGAEPGSAFELWTPPLYMEDPVNGVLTQRDGASLTLRSMRAAANQAEAGTGVSGPVIIRSGSAVTVDAGQSIDLLAYNVRVDGRLSAWGGKINLDVARQVVTAGSDYGSEAPGVIWIGEKAVLDVAARAVTATDNRGNRYGLVADGGTISLGGGMDWESNGEALAPNAYVVVRNGALLDASGTSATLDVNTGRSGRMPVTVASDGGTIVLKSSNNLYIDGTLRAAAGGDGAAGGTLAVALAPPNYLGSITGQVLAPREIVLSATQDATVPADMDPAHPTWTLGSGQTRLGIDRIKAGGFDNLSLFVDGALSFNGNVSLDLGQSIRLYAGGFALAEGAAADSRISLSAPQVRLAGTTRVGRDGYVLPNAGWLDAPDVLPGATDAIFEVGADLIELRDTVGFGVMGHNLLTREDFRRRGFGEVNLTSTGDLRFLQGLWGKTAGGAPLATYLETLGNLTLTAAQIYPATDASVFVTAGFMGRNTTRYAPGTSLTIRRSGTGDVAMPYSAFGSLSLFGETIHQGGIVRAPFGAITLGFDNGGALTGTRGVNLLAGSITSVSGAGLVMPYGGTVDGVNYLYDGLEISLASGALGSPIGKIRGAITINGASFTSEAGSVIDLSGGGELTGAGFVSGRNGSVDVLRTPLANANPGYGFSHTDAQVYAIVPSSKAGYAPIATDAGASNPVAGQQITIPAGVPGLPAGTYTLMPSTYALLPGAFRVEIGAGTQPGLSGVTSLANGSYAAAGTLGIANSDIRSVLPSSVLITPAAVVRMHSGYNETGYDAWTRTEAARNNVPRAESVADAASLTIKLGQLSQGMIDQAPVKFAGEVKQAALAKSDGFASVISVRGISEIRADGQSATAGLAGASVTDDDLNALNASRLMINSTMNRNYGPNGRFVAISGDSLDLTVRGGAVLAAGDVILGGGRKNGPYADATITIEVGASIVASARKPHTYDSSDGYIFSTEGAVVVSGGAFNLILADMPAGVGNTGLNIRIGACVTTSCDTPTQLIAGGTLALATNRVVTLADNVSYGAKDLVLGVSAVNLGEDAAIGSAGAAGQLPDGLVLNQASLAALLKGNTATGAPKLETLVLNARDAVNVYGSVELDASAVQRVVFGASAIYGYGAQGDVARIRAGDFVWTGADRTPGAPIASILGHGALDIQARSILFGYGPNTLPVGSAVDARLALGFSKLSLTATERVSASMNSNLSVYETRGNYAAGKGWDYSGGDLTITAPFVTGAAGAQFAVKAGGDVTINAPQQAMTLPTIDALGAQISIAGRNVTVDAAVLLPSGKLTLEAAQNLLVGERARIDLAGREITMLDVKRYSWGGDLIMSSAGGNITTAAGSAIDLSARNNRGGTMSVTALGAAAGRVDLLGAITGGATGQYDAGGTMVPYDGAELTVRGQTLTDFAGLNTRLNAGQVFGARRFQIKQGDLVVGDGVKARDVQIVLDGGKLTIDGRIDASGFQTGRIRLAALGDLTVNGTLDAHGTGLRVDSYGKIIDSPNRAIVELTNRAGTLTLADSAAIDLRAGTDAKSNDGKARGTLDLSAMRLGANDVAINVLGTLDVAGAKSIGVNAFRTYDDAPLAALPDVSGNRPQLITQAYLDGIDIQSRAFVTAALGNSALATRLAGLGGYELRPGVEIVSATPNGDLTVAGDIDLSGYRYGPNANSVRGMGAPGVLVLRAGGNLNIHGSINDGFGPPATTPDEDGWGLTETRDSAGNGVTPYGGDIVVPIDGVVLDTGTTYKAGATLNYDIPVGAMSLPAGTMLPIDAVLTASLSLSPGTVIDANIYQADGSIAYAAGTVLRDGATLTAGMKLGRGTSLRGSASFAALVWPKGIKLPVDMATTGQITLARGSLIPSMTKVELVGNAPVKLRVPGANGFQGRSWAVAPMLGEGATSWDMQLTAGADLTSVDTRALNVASIGAITLADTHYVVNKVPGGPRISANTRGIAALITKWGLPAGYTNRLLTGKTEPELIAIYGKTSWADFGLPNFWDPTSNFLEAALNLTGAQRVRTIAGRFPTGITNAEQMVGWTETEVVVAYRLTNWAPFGSTTFWNNGSIYIQPLVLPDTRTVTSPSFSVVRTGTGDLSMIAAGDIRMQSLYGVYTAGAATRTDAAYNLPRGTLSDDSVLGSKMTNYAAAMADYRAWYPDQGGNLLIAAGGDLTGDIRQSGTFSVTENGATRSEQTLATNLLGNWLWRQGSGNAGPSSATATAWWINFGSYTRTFDDQKADTQEWVGVSGFTGFGTLGGGDVTIRVGGDAGKTAPRGQQSTGSSQNDRSRALVVAVGSTGRVGSDGTLTLTGGGDLDMRVAGALNPFGEDNIFAAKTGLGGNIINARGTTFVDAASIGQIRTVYASNAAPNPIDPRGADLLSQTSAQAFSGPLLIPGDSSMYVQTLGDLVIGGAGDPTRSYQINRSPFSWNGTDYTGGGSSWFSLWTDHSAINLISAAGNMSPSTPGRAQSRATGIMASDLADSWPSQLRIAALGGNIYYGAAAILLENNVRYTSDTLAPSPSSELSVLAAGSIYAGRVPAGALDVARHGLVLSSTGTALPTPFNPAFVGNDFVGKKEYTNLSFDGSGYSLNTSASWNGQYALFAFGPNSATTAAPRSLTAEPIRIYALGGDIVGLGTGQTQSPFSAGRRTVATWYSAGAPLRMMAGRDIVSSGSFANDGRDTLAENRNLIVHSNATDISLVSAGRDILYSNFDVAGPGTLEVSAGRNILQEEKGSFNSLGALAIGDKRPGASIAVMAGMANGANWEALRMRYLDPANLADSAFPLAHPNNKGKVAKVYDKELIAWLGKCFGFNGTSGEAQAYFDKLAPEQQRVFLRQVYYAEAREGGREYNDPDGPRFASYLRGREMIAALFPDKDKDGKEIARSGDIIMFDGSGVRTNFGGDIELMAPGGQVIVGVQGKVPPATAGVVTQGAGDIRIFSEKSLLLGLSRIMTTFGGDIFAWSEQGDINAGRGAKTTIVFTPPKRTYDVYGNVALSPLAPSTGAGIATLNPIPEVAPGDIDLIAPLGTIDAGEAGIRVSGNINLVALQVLNAANIQVKGNATGIPQAIVVNTGALNAASSATAAVVTEATRLAERARPQVRTEVPTILNVRFLGFGE